MTSDGTNTYTWDRANRLLSMGGISYAYDGLGNRISQTANSVVTGYLNDVQPGLTKVLAETTSGSTTRFIHGPRGIQTVLIIMEWRGKVGNSVQKFHPGTIVILIHVIAR